MSTPTAGSFPVADLLPKKETNASLFLQKYPKYDGRGVIIAVLDTGIDPGAPGLQVTTDGKPKIIQLWDCSGSGDVDTSTVVKAENGTIKGLTGRTLKIPSTWSNPSGEYHIGMKTAVQLFPKDLQSRFFTQWREKQFEPSHRIAAAKAHGELVSFRERNEKDDKNVDVKSKLAEAEIQAANDVMASISKDYKDLGPTWDCVVFHDGSSWQAAIDTSEKGDLEKSTLLAPYSESFKYATIEELWFNYSVNIHDSGNLLELVTTCGSHGTHVAAIAAANFPDNPSQNGVAPGAQIVSINIGNHHLGTMETVNSLTRALIRLSKLGCVDVINMSYGEPSNQRPSPLMELFNDLVYKHNILFCHAAGNDGIGLSTTGSPTSHSLIHIGAYLASSMMLPQYSTSKNYEGSPYNFSSRGPEFFGSLGVSVCAPGAAITSVPNYQLASYQLMNGTSMASPNAAGCFSLLVSALKQENIAYSTFSVRRAVENTAFKPSHYEPFSMGWGLIQVDKAFEHLKTNQNLSEVNVDFRPGGSNSLGIYRRRAKCDAKDETIATSVKPCFLNEDDHRSLEENNLAFNLLLQSDKEWVESPSYLQLSHSTRSFEIKLHPSSLSPGVHFAVVSAYDSQNVEKGPLFRIPVTYVIAESYYDCKYYDKSENICSYPPVTLSPGQVERIFIKPPPGANMVHYTLKNLESKRSNIRASITQLRQDDVAFDLRRTLDIKEEGKVIINTSLPNESVVEFSFSKYCLSIDGDCKISAQISFSAIELKNQSKSMHTGNGIHRLDVLSRLDNAFVVPKISLKNASTYVRPSNSKITQLSPREMINDGKQLYQNVLTYTFTVPSTVEVKLSLADFDGTLYESEMYCQLIHLYDKNKQFLTCSDCFDVSPVKIDKGTYTALAHLWHHSKDHLKKFDKSPLRIQQKLAEKCQVTLYQSKNEAMARSTKASSVYLQKNATTPIYAVAPSDENLLKLLINPGSVLSGSFTLSTKSQSQVLFETPFSCVLDAPPSKSTDKETGKKEESKKISKDDHVQMLLGLKLSFVDSLEGEDKNALLKEIVDTECQPSEIAAVNICKIKAVEANTALDDKEKNGKIISLADEIIQSVNPVELLGSLEMTKVQVQVGAVKSAEMKKVEKHKERLVQAYLKKGTALAASLNNSNDIASSDDAVDKSKVLTELENIWLNVNNLTKGELASWADLKQTAKFLEAFYRTRGDSACLLKLYLKMQSELESSAEVEKKMIDLLATREDWSHLKAYYERCFNAKFPNNYLAV